jgi:hypothetical protein
MRQSRKVISNKLNTNITYPTVTNYWTPLYKNDDEEELTEEKINMLQQSIEVVQQPTSNKWKRRVEWRHKNGVSGNNITSSSTWEPHLIS